MRIKQRVYVVHECHGIPSGIVGSVLGYYARAAKRTYCVRFDDGDVREVPADALAPAGLDTAA